jgi:hypothetical protein
MESKDVMIITCTCGQVHELLIPPNVDCSGGELKCFMCGKVTPFYNELEVI